MFYSLISLITVLIVDISYGIVDPRVRMGGEK
jgi:ABC-type dipeptide/oligopeptide/nickel transport system permease component